MVISAAKQNIPKRFVQLLDGGDGNWSVAGICFYGLLLIIGLFTEYEQHRYW